MQPIVQPGMQPVATTFFFYFLSGLTLISGVLVITRKNPVHSALALIFGLLAQAGLYLMLYAPFVAGVQIILYAGGIMVLFLFVIMLVNLERSQKEEQFNKQWLVGLLAAVALGRPILYEGLAQVVQERVPEPLLLQLIPKGMRGTMREKLMEVLANQDPDRFLEDVLLGPLYGFFHHEIVGDVADEGVGGLSADVVHDGKHPPVCFRSRTDIGSNLVAERIKLRTGKIGQETL